MDRFLAICSRGSSAAQAPIAAGSGAILVSEFEQPRRQRRTPSDDMDGPGFLG
jgi:hypothetical protein